MNKKVLICDDEESHTTILKTFLEKKGVIIETFNNPIIAYQRVISLKENYFDVIIVDLFMPNIDGVEFIRKLKLFSHYISNTKFVVISGCCDIKKIDELTKLGVTKYISKPFDYKTITDELFD